jgi:hypothetical protein
MLRFFTPSVNLKSSRNVSMRSDSMSSALLLPEEPDEEDTWDVSRRDATTAASVRSATPESDSVLKEFRDRFMMSASDFSRMPFRTAA